MKCSYCNNDFAAGSSSYPVPNDAQGGQLCEHCEALLVAIEQYARLGNARIDKRIQEMFDLCGHADASEAACAYVYNRVEAARQAYRDVRDQSRARKLLIAGGSILLAVAATVVFLLLSPTFGRWTCEECGDSWLGKVAHASGDSRDLCSDCTQKADGQKQNADADADGFDMQSGFNDPDAFGNTKPALSTGVSFTPSSDPAYLAGNRHYEAMQYMEAVPYLTDAAERGIPDAKYLLACCYLDGKGVSPDTALGIQLLEAAATGGVVPAQALLGDCYLNATGVKEDLPSAFYWLSCASEGGNATAQANLSYCYRRGLGVPDSISKEQSELNAFYWARQSAAQNNPSGLINLGYCYHKGIGTQISLPDALENYLLARDAGHEYAQKRINEVKEEMRAAEAAG